MAVISGLSESCWHKDSVLSLLKKALYGNPAGISILFAGLSTLWVVSSDNLLNTLPSTWNSISYLASMKGLFYVAISSLTLYFLLCRWRKRLLEMQYRTWLSEQRLQRVLKGTHDGWWDWDLHSNKIEYSDRWWQMLGYRSGMLSGDSDLWRRLMHPEDLGRVEAMFQEALQSDKEVCILQSRMRHRKGHYVPVLIRYLVQRDEQGQPCYVSGSCTDITALREAEERLKQAALVFDTTHEGILVTDQNNRILMVNKAFYELTGYAEEEVVGHNPSLLSSGYHKPDFYRDMYDSLSTQGRWQGEIWNRRKQGEIYPQWLNISAVRDESGHISQYVGVFSDISHLKSSERKLDYLANYDALTGLPNRTRFISELKHKVALAGKRKIAVLLCDLDRFKDVNDSYGHGQGDELLQRISRRLAVELGEENFLARLGGDEFALLDEHVRNPEDAARLANKLSEIAAGPWTLSNDVRVKVSVSVGISLYPLHGNNAELLVQQADAALYQAKGEGRSCFRFFSENLTQMARARLELEARLHRALQNDEFRVYFQPQVDIQTNGIVGAEALVRWQDPEQGLISPASFIPVAEATGQILAIGNWVLKNTLLAGRAWLDAGLPELTLAVNISSRQFSHGDLVKTVTTLLEETGFPARLLELELTESMLIDCDEALMDEMRHLKAMGIQLALDDFGTGYSSLAYLNKLPIDQLKIDRSFICNMEESRQDLGIISTIIAMGQIFGFRVLAEGVEEPRQLAQLSKLGCHSYQGYLCSQPLPAEDFARMLAQKR